MEAFALELALEDLEVSNVDRGATLTAELPLDKNVALGDNVTPMEALGRRVVDKQAVKEGEAPCDGLPLWVKDTKGVTVGFQGLNVPPKENTGVKLTDILVVIVRVEEERTLTLEEGDGLLRFDHVKVGVDGTDGLTDTDAEGERVSGVDTVGCMY